MLKFIRRQLPKSAWIKRAIANYFIRLKKERHSKHWAEIMSSGKTIRKEDKETPNSIRPLGVGRWKL